MLKKITSFTMALVICLMLIPMTALAYGDQWIQMDKSNYDPNEEIVVTVSGLTRQQVEVDYAFVAIFKKGAAHDDYLESQWLYGDCYDGTKSVVSMEVPAESGDYEMRLFRQDYTYADEDVVTVVPFTVGKVAKDGAISLNKSAYTAFEQITVSVSGITEQMVNAKAFVSLCEKGEKHSEATVNWNVEQGSSTVQLHAPNKNGEFEVRLYSMMYNYTDEALVMSVPFTVSGATGSDWAQSELEKANKLGLIPENLKGKDLAKPITRAEFAAVSVKLYENLSGTKATPIAVNPFKDTKDEEVLRAFNIGVTNGYNAAGDMFEPNLLLNREQAATMLTRVWKKYSMPNWTLATDGNFTLEYTKPEPFKDDDKISAWAKDSVYFMAANKIILGDAGNFKPKNTSASEEAISYANATREQALIIAVRIVENLKK